jgi:phage repressor protein C with HTH and peptisase S24 domain
MVFRSEAHMWRIAELREDRHLSQAELARRINENPQTLGRWEKGQRRVPQEALERIADVLGCRLQDLVADGGVQPAARPPSWPGTNLARGAGRADIPVIAGTADGAGLVVQADRPVDFVPRPPQLAAVPDAYAVYMAGTAMSPRLEPGWLLYVHPARPPAPGNAVVVRRADGHAQVGLYVGAGPKGVTIAELAPKYRETTIAEAEAVHLIVGTWVN